MRVEKNQTNNRTYAYDAANQLVEFVDNDYMEAYTYDDVGNMLEKTINSTATNYSYNNGNQLVLEVTNGQAIGYTYNDNGDLTYKTTGEQYDYDIQGNLTSIVGNGIDKQYTYNGNGNRLSETTDGDTVYYVNDINRRYEEVVQTYDEDGNVINTYTYGVDRIQSVGENTETYLYDGRGSVVGAVNADNEFISYSYTAYGELMPNSPQPQIFGYNAEATDFETGMQYLRARYYDIGIGRFFQEDDYRGEFTRPSSMNRYTYTEGNPILYTDPSGYVIFGVWLSAIVAEDDAARTGVIVNTAVTYIMIGALTALTAAASASALAIFAWVAANPILVYTIIGAIAAGIGEIAGQVVTSLMRGEKIKIDWTKVLVSVAVGAFSGLIGGALVSKSVGLTKLQAFLYEMIVYDSAGTLTKILAGEIIDENKESQEKEAETPAAEESALSPCEPNNRYVYDDELDMLYDQKSKLEVYGNSAAVSAINAKIDIIEGEKVRHIDEQIDILNDQINKVDAIGCSSAIKAMEEEKRKLEEDKMSVLNNTTKPVNPQPSTGNKQPINSPVKKVAQIGKYGIAKPQLMAYKK